MWIRKAARFFDSGQVKRQRLLPFQVICERRQRQFRRLIIVMTVVVLGELLFIRPFGRRFMGSLGTRAALARF